MIIQRSTLKLWSPKEMLLQEQTLSSSALASTALEHGLQQSSEIQLHSTKEAWAG